MGNSGAGREEPPGAGGSQLPGNQPVRQQEVLWRELLGLADLVAEALRSAVEALCRGRLDLVDRVRSGERETDRWEVRIETECFRLLALYGLVASDLRRIIAALRVNGDLESLADLAENLAKRARKLANDPVASRFDQALGQLADEALAIVDRSFAALRALDADQAREVMLAQKTIERHRSAILADLKTALRAEPDHVKTWLRLMSSARNLERMADHAHDIAAAVVYVKTGVLARRHDPDD